MYILFQILFPFRLLQNIKYSSLLVTDFIDSSVYMLIPNPSLFYTDVDMNKEVRTT